MTAPTLKTVLEILLDISFSIMLPVFYSTVLSMRFKRWKYLVIFPIALCLLMEPITYLIRPPQYILFFSGLTAMLLGIFIFSDDKPLKKILVTLIPYIVNIITSSIYYFLKSIFLPDFKMTWGDVEIIDLLFEYVTSILPLFLIARWIQRKKPDLSDLTIIYIICIVIAQMIIMTIVMYVYYSDLSVFSFMSAFLVYMAITLLLTTFIIRYSIRVSREQNRKELIANQYEQLSVQYGQLRSSYIGYKKLRHDLKDHIRVIRGLSQRGEISELNEYTKKLTEDWDSLSAKTFCDIPAVDIVLADKYNLAVGNGIKTDFAVSGISEAGADNIYLCSIFANLLNNALEAAQYCETDPFIELRSGIRMDRLVIVCRNSMPHSVPPKSDPQQHGYGLHIIKELSELLDGNFVYENDSSTFTATVTIPVKKKEEPANDSRRSN